MKNNYFNIVISIASFLVPLVLIPTGLGDFFLPKYYILIACGIMLLIGLFKNYKAIKTDNINYTTFLYLVFAIISTITAILPNLALTRIKHKI